jgi:hypothetical protein
LRGGLPEADERAVRRQENTAMLIGFSPEDLERFAIPIGIGIAVLLILIVPALRRSMIDSYKKGKETQERLTGKQKPEADKDEGTSGS